MTVVQLLLLVPSAVVVGFALLLLTAWLEQRLLSPRVLITRAVRVRNSPDLAEQLVADQAKELLRRHRLDR